MDVSQSEGSVLGVTDFGPVAGSPLLPPQLLTIYFVIFLILIVFSYTFLHWRKQPITLWHKIKLLTVTVIALKVFLVGGGGLLALYWLVPTPNVTKTTPADKTTGFSPTNKLEIIFDRPVRRGTLEKSISPDIPGRWVFENSIYTTHLYRKLVFYPTYSFKPDTEYKITLSEIKSISGFSKPYTYNFSYKTQASPKVASVTPVSGSENIEINEKIVVALSDPNINISQFDFEFDPKIDFDQTVDDTTKVYTLTPKEQLKQGTKYLIKVKKSDVILNLQDGTVFERTPQENQYEGSFKTKEAPGLSTFEPSKSNSLITDPIKLSFSQKMDKKSVEESFLIEPKVNGTISWEGDQNLTFKPERLNYETEYKVKIPKGTKASGSGFIEEDINKSFTTIGAVKVQGYTPANNWTGVNVHSPIKITFDQEVDKPSAQSKFTISPQASGSFTWQENTLTFTPDKPLSFTTEYTITLAQGIKSIKGQPSKSEFKSAFKTQDTTTKLGVPAYLQKYTLSCELASLRMALAFRGVSVSEDTLLSQVGVDPTPHNGNIWGDPYALFVGNVNGTQMRDGYGVHWGPIARVAKMYRNAQDFSGWNITQLTEVLAAGNPVVIWVYSGGGYKTSWNTPDGRNIFAVRDEHAVTAVGFVGPPGNPSQVIINDPLSGQVYLSRTLFDKKWGIFNNSGVVVY